MEKFSYNTFLSQIQRLSCNGVQQLLKKYQKDLEKMPIVETNQMFNFIENKFGMVQQWQSKGAMTDVLTFKMIATRVPELSSYVFEEIDNLNKLHPTIQVEVANLLDENEKINLLNNFGIIVMESDHELSLINSYSFKLKTYKYGKSYITILRS